MTQDVQNKLETAQLRERLVEAAEKVAADLVEKSETPKPLPEKTQMSRLLSVARSAFCGAEIRNYLRYQAARKVWPKVQTDTLIDRLETIMADAQLKDREQVRAWELFSGYLTRAYVYELARRGQ
jgi:hypothetical protein